MRPAAPFHFLYMLESHKKLLPVGRSSCPIIHSSPYLFETIGLAPLTLSHKLSLAIHPYRQSSPPFLLTQTSLLNHTTYFSPIHLHPLYADGQLHTCYVFTHGSAFMGKIGCSRRPSPLGNTASSLW